MKTSSFDEITNTIFKENSSVRFLYFMSKLIENKININSGTTYINLFVHFEIILHVTIERLTIFQVIQERITYVDIVV